MNKVTTISIAALASAACVSGVSVASNSPDAPSRDQQRALRTLEGRTALAPVACVDRRDLGSSQSLPDGSILFKGRTSRFVYVNSPPAGCPALGAGKAMRTRSTSTQMCRGDIAEVFDPVSSFSYGGCGLGEFTPYRREG